jgi:hypothetical protein
VRPRGWAVIVLGLLAGCASERWVYSKPGVTPARLGQELELCRRHAVRPQRFAISREGRLDQDAIRECMEHKGYTSRRGD